MEKHTQGVIEHSQYKFGLIGTNMNDPLKQMGVCQVLGGDEEAKANAERIVKAWNNYDTLKKALEDILEQTRVNNNYADTCAAMKSKAATALQKAKQY